MRLSCHSSSTLDTSNACPATDSRTVDARLTGGSTWWGSSQVGLIGLVGLLTIIIGGPIGLVVHG